MSKKTKAVGYAVNEDDMHWTVNCPECNSEHEYEGYYDAEDDNTCKCGCVFRTERVWINEKEFIQ